jgi:hypothetical protein
MEFGDSDRIALAPGDAGAVRSGVERASRALVGRGALATGIVS